MLALSESKEALTKHLQDYLQSHHSRDVLMPTKASGSKAPKYIHRGGEWTWARFAALRQHDDDVCVVLHDLCVIDVDSAAQADELEARFPALRAAPCEATARGRHYFFARTPAADAHGYYDGAAQREVGIDFKSITRTGTGGIVVVAPSTGKTWTRPPWSSHPPWPLGAPLSPIPDDILDAVAAPSHATVDVVLSFADGGSDVLLHGCRYLRAMSVFERLFKDHVGIVGAGAGTPLRLDVPVDQRIFRELLHVLEHGDLSCAPSDVLFVSLASAALALRIPPHLLACLRSDRFGRPREQAGLYALEPAWWRVDVEERALRRAGMSADGALLRVNASLARELLFSGPRAGRDDRWLLAGLDRAGGPFTPGERVLCEDPSGEMQDALPATVATILAAHAGHIVLAGGAVTGAVVDRIASGSDYDLFVYGLNAEAADTLASTLIAAHKATHAIYESSRAITFIPKADGDADVEMRAADRWRSSPLTKFAEGKDGGAFQLVLRLHRDRAQVLEAFDFAPTKALARIDEETQEVIVEALPSWLEAVRARAFWVVRVRSSARNIPAPALILTLVPRRPTGYVHPERRDDAARVQVHCKRL